MAVVTMYSAHACGYCSSAERLLRRKGVIGLRKILVDTEPGQLEQMIARTGRRTVPQVFIDDRHVGGFEDLSALDRSGQLDRLLAR